MISFYIDRDIARLKQVRIAQAITVTAPPWALVLQDAGRADVQVLQVSALNARSGVKAPRYAVVQHAHRYEHRMGERDPIVVPEGFNPWEAVWSKALAVWSPVDVTAALAKCSKAQPYIAPFGVDLGVFRPHGVPRDVGIVTSGHSNHSEAIQEAAAAAALCGLTTVHLGPWEVAGLNAAMPGRSIVNSLTDNELAALYSRSRWVSGLRYFEGFELPVLEGLACGARPIVFDTPENRAFYGDHPVFVPVCQGEQLVQELQRLLSLPVTAREDVQPAELQQVQDRYDWERLARGYWSALEAACKADPSLSHRMAPAPPAVTARPRLVAANERKRRLLWIGDSPTTAWTGFGRAAFNIINQLKDAYDVSVCGTTFDGCPYDHDAMPYGVYPISKGVQEVIRLTQPDVIVAQHDPWHVQQWLRDAGKIPVVGIMPIDGKNCRTDYLNELAMAIWWTQFAEAEARIGGYTGPSRVIPLGVDLETFRPVDKQHTRKFVGLPEHVQDAFIVGCVARNQPRKRLDLTVRHFAEWVHSRDIKDAYLYIQTAPTGEAAYDVNSLMRYEKLEHRLLLVTPAVYRTLPEIQQAGVINSLDVYFTTTQGEGWGLPVQEAMASGVPVVAPDWSGLGSWAKDGALLVPCCDVAGTINTNLPPGVQRIAVLGGVPDKQANITALDALYHDREFYGDVAARGLALVNRPEFRWDSIGQAVTRAVDDALAMKRTTGAVLQPVLG